MPTVLRVHGLQFVIWPNDHIPPHLHVFSADAEATILLGEPGGYPGLLENLRMGRRDLARALETVLEHQSMFLRRLTLPGLHVHQKC
ncbi:MAG: DUF4160 domain-containing protein [Proteobacteria bacterium]|nr:DUF4160 domain-containing protein [Pseudomonadota bacterium]